jgi:tRNA modification GTPase
MRAESTTTIAAIATGAGGGVGIIRISGPAAEDIGRRLCSPWPAELVSHHLYLGSVRDPHGEPLDQVLFCLMRGPRSYTGEDVLEIHGHGGEQNLTSLLMTVLHAGAALAGPGDFTRRAFLAGKLDLTQAEGLAAAIGAQSQEALRHAQRHLTGEMGRRIGDLRRQVMDLLGTIEAALDFPEVDEELAPTTERLRSLQQQTADLGDSFVQGGRALSQGLRITLLGKVNAGKSSLVNAVCGSERILVHDQPGTTRDYVEVRTHFNDRAVVLIDTAGYREQGTELEEQGWRLSRQQSGQADLIWLVVNGGQGLDETDERVLGGEKGQAPCLVIWNKVDQRGCREPPASHPVVCCSALCGWGLEDLRQRSLALVASRAPDELVVTSARQAQLLSDAAQLLSSALWSLERAQPWDIVAADLREAASKLGELTGEHTRPDVLDAVFNQFCIGK